VHHPEAPFFMVRVENKNKIICYPSAPNAKTKEEAKIKAVNYGFEVLEHIISEKG
jgi:hypothetical protein